MAVVKSARKRPSSTGSPSSRCSIATLIFLAPIYWIGSTAFKPKELAITVPPTVFFQPEITPFIRLFTKRVQLQKPVDPAVYAAAPWWEKRIYDGGERVLRVGDDVQLSQYPEPLLEQPDHRHHQHRARGVDGNHHRLRLLALQDAGEADLLFFILSTRMLPPIVVAIPMFLMYRAVGLNDTHLGLIILYVAFNLSFSVWLMKGFMDEIPKEYEEAALVDGYTRLAGLLQDRAARSGDRHRRHRGVLLHHRLERICLRPDHDQPPGADRAALHSLADRLGPA